MEKQPETYTCPSVEKWLTDTRELLELEWSEENEMAVSELATTSARELERRGVSLLKLQVDHVNSGLYGKTTVTFGRYHGVGDALLAANNFGVGDIVRVVPQDYHGVTKSDNQHNQPPSGVVSKVTPSSISVAFGDNDMESDSLRELQHSSQALRLDKLPNDATHKRLSLALVDLERASNHPSCYSSHLIQAVFGVSSPRQDAQYVTGNFGGSTTPVTKDTIQSVQTLITEADLNESQRASIDFCLRTRDIGLIHGPPGTGKTTTVVELIQRAVQLGNRVLVCAPSNVAVDNIVVRLANSTKPEKRKGNKGKQISTSLLPVKMVRVGHPARLLPQVVQHSLDAMIHQSDEKALANDARQELQQALNTLYGGKDDSKRAKKQKPSKVNYRELRSQVKELRAEVKKRERTAVGELLKQCNVIMATNVGAASLHRHVRPSATEVPSEAPFDLVIIDEAAQAIEAGCWIPLLLGKRAVLVGDHKQLPPTIKSDEAARRGLGLTLFDRVTRMYGERVTKLLNVQYRMNVQIMQWASQELYHGKLEAFPGVAARTLNDLAHYDPTKCGPVGGLEYELASSVLVLMDTAGADMLETVDESSSTLVGSRSNEGEAGLVLDQVKRLTMGGLLQSEIAVVTPYNAQVQLIRTLLADTFPHIEVRSVDGFQGREKEAIVLSLVRSNKNGQVGFLSDERRMNVAITRAKRQVYLICDSDTVGSTSGSFLSRMLAYFEQHAWLAIPHGNNKETVVSATLPPEPRPGNRNPVQKKLISAPKTETVKVSVPPSRVAEIKTILLELKANVETCSYSFPSTLSSAERRIVHQLCEELELEHESKGEGTTRFIIARTQHHTVKVVDTQSNITSGEETNVITASVNRFNFGSESETESVVSDESNQEKQIQVNEETFTNKVYEESTVRPTPKQAEYPQVSTSTQVGKSKVDDSVENQSDDDQVDSDSEHDEPLGSNTESVCRKPIAKEIQDLRALQAARYLAAKSKQEKEEQEKAKQWLETPASSTSSNISSNKVKKKKKKKSKAGKKQGASDPKSVSSMTTTGNIIASSNTLKVDNDEVDEEMALLDSLLLASDKCIYMNASTGKSCKKSTKIMGMDCRHCKERFCFKHGQPEIHGCAGDASVHAKQVVRNSVKAHSDSKQLKGPNRDYVRKQLADRISGCASDRMSSASKEAASKTKKKKKRN